MTENRLYPHVPIIADDGNGGTPGVLAIHAMLTPSPEWPKDVRILIGSPQESLVVPGPLPHIHGFHMGIPAALELIRTLQQAVSDVRQACGHTAVSGPLPTLPGGFVRIGRIDHDRRLSLWLKEEPGKTAFELRAGRGGHDVHVRVTRENPQFTELEQAVSYARFAAEWESSIGDTVDQERAALEAYAERNLCVAGLARMAMRAGWRCGLGRHQEELDADTEWDPEWINVVFIDLPTGQVSWHIHDSEMPLFAGWFPTYDEPWDGHTTAEKYERLKRL